MDVGKDACYITRRQRGILQFFMMVSSLKQSYDFISYGDAGVLVRRVVR